MTDLFHIGHWVGAQVVGQALPRLAPVAPTPRPAPLLRLVPPPKPAPPLITLPWWVRLGSAASTALVVQGDSTPPDPAWAPIRPAIERGMAAGLGDEAGLWDMLMQWQREYLERIRRQQNDQPPLARDEVITARHKRSDTADRQVSATKQMPRPPIVNSTASESGTPHAGGTSTAPAIDPDAAPPFDVRPFLAPDAPIPTSAQFLAILRALYRRPMDLRRFFGTLSRFALPVQWPNQTGVLVGRLSGPDESIRGLRYVEGDPIWVPTDHAYFRVKGHLRDGGWQVITARGQRAMKVAQAIHNLPPLQPVELALLAYQWNTQFVPSTSAQKVTLEQLVEYLRGRGVIRALTLLQQIDPHNYGDSPNGQLSLRGQVTSSRPHVAVYSLRLLTSRAAASEGALGCREGFELGLARSDNGRWVVRAAKGTRALDVALAVQGWERHVVAKAFLAGMWGGQYQAKKPSEAVTSKAVLKFLRTDGLTAVRADRLAIDPTLGSTVDWRMRGTWQRRAKRNSQIVRLRLLTVDEATTEGEGYKAMFDIPLHWDGDRFTVAGQPTGSHARDIAGAIEAPR